jgi:hypothetical protein
LEARLFSSHLSDAKDLRRIFLSRHAFLVFADVMIENHVMVENYAIAIKFRKVA